VPRDRVPLARLLTRQVLHGFVVLLFDQLQGFTHPLDHVDRRRSHVHLAALVSVGLQEAVLQALLLKQQINAPQGLRLLNVL